MSPVFPTFAFLSLFYLIKLIKDEKLILAVAPSCLFILLTVVSILAFQQRIFPFVKVVLKKREKIKFGFDEFQALIIIVAGLVTILQFIHTLLINKK
jgi:formate hydrogenlyase subunit 3/multisubunit Na+/H+ antiporter MnhD subunit